MPKVSLKKRTKDDGESEGLKKKKPKKKKDPNAPKRGMSAFMFFSNTERDVSSKSLFSALFDISIFYFLDFVERFKNPNIIKRIMVHNIRFLNVQKSHVMGSCADCAW